ncbi:MAG: pyridoxine 5'-phosphate synthase [Gemmatimonadaceae bacterium]
MTSATRRLRLYVNVDHVATVRQARRTDEPDPSAAARECEDAGADGITAHLREDRRHIQDADIDRLVRDVRTVVNLEMACTDEMIRIAERLRPYQVTFVPERREEVTTEGGLDVAGTAHAVGRGIERLRVAGVRVSLFVDPREEAIVASCAVGAQAIELHTGTYANERSPGSALAALNSAAHRAADLGLAVHAGHGLTVRNVGAVAAIDSVEELNIGHAIISRAIFIGLRGAVREMRAAMAVAPVQR